MNLRHSILELLRRRTGDTLTRDIAAATGASNADVYRELVKLETEGAVTHRLGPATIGNVGWRLTSEVSQ